MICEICGENRISVDIICIQQWNARHKIVLRKKIKQLADSESNVLVGFEMGKGKDLSLEERRQIFALAQKGVPIRLIATTVGRSLTAVRNTLVRRRWLKKNTREKCGRPRILSDKNRRLIIFLGQTRSYSVRDIQRQVPFKVSRSTIHRIISQSREVDEGESDCSSSN